MISKDIIEYEMHNANVFASEEKMSLTAVANLLEEAHSTCFTVCFTAKVDEKTVTERLSKCSAAELKEGKALAKEILAGKETTITGRLSKADGKLGRSLVVELNT